MKRLKNKPALSIITVIALFIYIIFMHYIQFEYEKLNDKLQIELTTLLKNCITQPNPSEKEEYENP